MVSKIIIDVMEYCCLFVKHFFDSILFNMVDMCLVMCMYK